MTEHGNAVETDHALLEIRRLHAGYDALDVVRDVSLHVARGEFVAVLGPNGAGKSTLLGAVSRTGARIRSGAVVFAGKNIVAAAPEAIVRLGCSHVPEGRALFTELTVDDNLRLGGYTRRRADAQAAVHEIYERFPALAARRSQRASSLSGGEAQMLAIGRALVAKPSLLMLDEPSTGLAPLVVEQIFQIATALVRSGTALLVVEQNAYLTLRYAQRAYILESGSVSLTGPAAALRDDPRVRAIYLGGGTQT